MHSGSFWRRRHIRGSSFSMTRSAFKGPFSRCCLSNTRGRSRSLSLNFDTHGGVDRSRARETAKKKGTMGQGCQMAAIVGGVCVTVTLLVWVPGGQALDLLRATASSGNPPSTPTVTCRCTSYPNITLCSWPESPRSPPTHYVATYSERHSQQDTKHCHLIPPNSSSYALNSSSSFPSEKLWHCQLPNLKLLTSYIINVTAVYSGGSSSNLASFMLEDIVKPDPPVDVRVSPHSTRNLLVEWSPPFTWTNQDIFPLKYQLMYQWEYGGTPKSVKLGPFESTKIELKGLTAGREYLFQVCAKELLGLGECSNWSSPVNITIPRIQP